MRHLHAQSPPKKDLIRISIAWMRSASLRRHISSVKKTKDGSPAGTIRRRRLHGANMERPALKRLLADVEAGKMDCIVVYKYDRLSRSLADFMKLLEILDKHHVTFVAVTQPFDTRNIGWTVHGPHAPQLRSV